MNLGHNFIPGVDQSDQDNGLHVIMLDARSGRDPTYSTAGECKGSATRILTEAQWAWLEQELDRESEIKIIGSGIQVSWSAQRRGEERRGEFLT